MPGSVMVNACSNSAPPFPVTFLIAVDHLLQHATFQNLQELEDHATRIWDTCKNFQIVPDDATPSHYFHLRLFQRNVVGHFDVRLIVHDEIVRGICIHWSSPQDDADSEDEDPPVRCDL